VPRTTRKAFHAALFKVKNMTDAELRAIPHKASNALKMAARHERFLRGLDD
jgi:hypothetical protein